MKYDVRYVTRSNTVTSGFINVDDGYEFEKWAKQYIESRGGKIID